MSEPNPKNRPGQSKESIPADEEIEKYVLGSALDKEVRSQLALERERHLFFFPTSKIILQALLDLDEAGTPISFPTLTQHLAEKKSSAEPQAATLLESVGGPAAIVQLETRYRMSPAVARHELDALRKLYRKREAAKI